MTRARRYLNVARRMARHSITEARRAVVDLRAAALEGQDLGAALQTNAKIWVANSNVEIRVDAAEDIVLPSESEQHLLRIAQESVTNVIKHAKATKIILKLYRESSHVHLQIADNGCGFDNKNVFQSEGGHFGLIGMRERAERLDGEFRLRSSPQEGTQIDVKVPLP